LKAGDGIEALASRLGQSLLRKRALCATAESCTGGLVAGAITDIAGSSAWFERGFVTYTNESKQALLGVPDAVLREHGAVSEATARAMAEGALARSPVHLAVAVTGIAGPGGGTPAKPVGMVCFAWAGKGLPTTAITRHFPGGRADVRRAAIVAALEGLVVCAEAMGDADPQTRGPE
jgi:nicotinamide-nucleotide amidase